ncbi:MAG TPA: hypothetical protein V6C85_34495 [Allocoleopsis sp.]
MYEEHRTHDGIRMLIGQMEDSHLLNTIKSYCDKIEQCTRIIKGQSTPDTALIETFNPEFSREAVRERAQETIRFLHQRIQPYVLTAVMRGLGASVTPHLTRAYQCSGRLSTNLFELPSSDEIIDGHTHAVVEVESENYQFGDF